MLSKAKVTYLRENPILKNHLSDEDITVLIATGKVFNTKCEFDFLGYSLTPEGVECRMFDTTDDNATWSDPVLILPF